MPELRDNMFLGSKTRFRTRDEAWRDVESIMKRMNVENFDLFQLHSVVNLHELDLATAEGGALETLTEMRDQGLTKWLGITGHGPYVPSTILESLRRFDFDTVMFPLNPAMARDCQLPARLRGAARRVRSQGRRCSDDQDDRAGRLGIRVEGLPYMVRPTPRAGGHRPITVVGVVTADAHRAELR